LCAWLYAGNPLRGAPDDAARLRAQLAAAEETEAKPAIIELSKRLLEVAPKDSAVWQKLARMQLEVEDLDRCGATLDAWEKAVRPTPIAIEDLRGDLFFARKDYKNAEQHWLAFLAKKPPRDDAIATLQALADLYVDQSRWRDNLEFRARIISLQDTAANRVGRATAFLRLHRWDDAFADMKKANALDPSDTTVKEWLPQFERLESFLPKIKALDAQIAKAPNDFSLLLERARVFTLAERPLLALDDCEQAMKLQPASMRARIQTAEALLDTSREKDANKLQVSSKLVRQTDKHVSGGALSALGENDALLLQNPRNVDPLALRARTLRDLRQLALAIKDSQAAVEIDDKSAAAHLEAARDLDGLDDSKNALAHAVKATELNPDDGGAWYLRGALEAERADYPTAIESLTRSLKLGESLEPLRLRENCERRIGKTKEADVDLSRIRQLAPETQ
jgi:tetratricopeptide (TPR) repeat protein